MSEQLVRIDLEGKSVVNICLDILNGKYSSLMERRDSDGTVFHDDRELQMSTCFFLGKNASTGDQRIIDGLLRKIGDNRPL